MTTQVRSQRNIRGYLMMLQSKKAEGVDLGHLEEWINALKWVLKEDS